MTRNLHSICKIPFDIEQRSRETFWNYVYWRGIWFRLQSSQSEHIPNPYLSFDVLQCGLEKKETQLWVDSIKKSMQTCGMSHHAITKYTLVSFLDLNVEVLGPSEMVLGDDGSGECTL